MQRAASNPQTALHRLHTSLQCRRGVIVVGGAATGKSAIIETLELALRDISATTVSGAASAAAAPLPVIVPGALTLPQLFGGLTGDREWIDGVVNVALRALATPAPAAWLRLDGPADPSWMEQLNTVRTISVMGSPARAARRCENARACRCCCAVAVRCWHAAMLVLDGGG